MEEPLQHGYWLVAFVDLLGQREAFMKTDFVPTANDPPEKTAAFYAAVKDSIGAIRSMREILKSFTTSINTLDEEAYVGLTPEQRKIAEGYQQTRVRQYKMSDGMVLACPLSNGEGHCAIRGVYNLMATCATLMIAQLAKGKPVRGGIDVGTGIEIDDEVFGACLVKAYTLESEVAGYPRIVVGKDFGSYLATITQRQGNDLDAQFGRRLGERLTKIVTRDHDDNLILDYAGANYRSYVPGVMDMLPKGIAFAKSERERFRSNGNKKLFERYSRLEQYFDRAAPNER